MLTLLLILVIIACILLVFIILAQNPKGGGLSSMGAGASQFLGARQTADFLEKSTWYFGIGILTIVVMSYFLTGTPDQSVKFKSEQTNGYVPTGLGGNGGPAAPAAPGAANPSAPAATPATPSAPANGGNQ